MKKILLILLACMLLAAIGGTAFFLNLKYYAEQPAHSAAEKVLMNIPAGQSLKVTTEALFQKKIITSPFKFNLVARFKGYDKRLKAGEYSLSSSMSPLQII
ncbi:MAG: endolytic transglycosylase MltG [Deltaproteobacteria bacterium]|nr:endolytic transglycosylase MltG [Deltaproteobacteria bacterium]